MPEKLTGQNPENTAQLTDRLSQTLASLPDGANFRTDEMIIQDGIFLMERLARQRRGFLGLGRKRVDVEDPDHLWVATQILYPGKEALEKYFITASALIRALGKNVEEETAEDIYNRLTRDEELLNKLNSSQIIHGENAVLTLLDDLIKEEQTKEEAKESAVETADYVVLDSFGGWNKGGRAENKDFVAYPPALTPEDTARLFVVADGSHGGSLFVDPKNAVQQLYADLESAPTMANSIAAALIKGHNLHIAHLGNSRAYLLRDGQLTLLTDDDETQKTIRLAKRDKILLCTDGLWGPVDDEAIGSILSNTKNSIEAVTQLITDAVNKGGKQADNIGVSVINVENLVKGKIKAQTETTPTEAAHEEPATPDAENTKSTLEMGAYSEPAPNSRNEDRYIFNSRSGLAAMFDGDGLDAAQAAREVVGDFPAFNSDQLPDPEQGGLLMTELLTSIEGGLSKRELGSEQTTAAIVKQVNHPSPFSLGFVVGKVGNSRVYLFHREPNHLSQIGMDDSESRFLADFDDIPVKGYEQEYYARRNTLTYVLRAREGTDFWDSINSFTAVKGDLIILTTPGVHQNLNRFHIQEIVKKGVEAGYSAESISAKLVLAARHFAETDTSGRGIQKDTTALVVTLK